ncbi:hypothetical protein Q3G72_033628 [Acer saccharum]|nr:hypothetical protein Q3G72_033628 [Acer saccharum]
MVVVHGDYGRNLTGEVGPIEASSRSIFVCAWVDPLVGTCSHSNKRDSILPSHVNSPSSAKVVSSNPIALAIFFDSVSLTASREQQSGSVNAIPIVRSSTVVPVLNDSSVDIGYDLSLDFLAGQVSSFSRSETPLESFTTSGLISDVCSTIPIQAILVIDSLVQTVSSTVGLSLQRPRIMYADHRVRKDCYESSQIPSSVAGSTRTFGL